MPTSLDNGRLSPKATAQEGCRSAARAERKVKKPPTDFALLKAIYERHSGDFERYQSDVQARAKRIIESRTTEE